jgi:hypothetical protein
MNSGIEQSKIQKKNRRPVVNYVNTVSKPEPKVIDPNEPNDFVKFILKICCCINFNEYRRRSIQSKLAPQLSVTPSSNPTVNQNSPRNRRNSIGPIVMNNLNGRMSESLTTDNNRISVTSSGRDTRRSSLLSQTQGPLTFRKTRTSVNSLVTVVHGINSDLIAKKSNLSSRTPERTSVSKNGSAIVTNPGSYVISCLNDDTVDDDIQRQQRNSLTKEVSSYICDTDNDQINTYTDTEADTEIEELSTLEFKPKCLKKRTKLNTELNTRRNSIVGDICWSLLGV